MSAIWILCCLLDKTCHCRRLLEEPFAYIGLKWENNDSVAEKKKGNILHRTGIIRCNHNRRNHTVFANQIRICCDVRLWLTQALYERRPIIAASLGVKRKCFVVRTLLRLIIKYNKSLPRRIRVNVHNTSCFCGSAASLSWLHIIFCGEEAF